MRNLPSIAVFGGALLGSGLAMAQPQSDNANLNLSPNEIQTNLVKILRTTNKAQTNRYVPKVYEFHNNNPYDVAWFIRRMAEIEESAWFIFANEEMNGGKVLLSVPEYQLPGIDLMMAELDRPGLTTSSGEKQVQFRLRHRDGSDPALQNVVAQEGTPTAGLDFDDQLNAWFFQDAPSGIERIAASALGHYDQPTPQLEALIKVYEIDITDDGQLGLDYLAWKNGPGRNLFSIGAFAQKEKISTLDGPGTSALLYNSGKDTQHLNGNTWHATGRSGAYFYDMPSAYFDFLVTKGEARIISQTKATVLDRSTALLEIGEQILYYQEQDLPDLRAGSRLRPLDPYGDLEAVVDTVAANEITDDYNVLLADHPDNRTVQPALLGRSLGVATSGLFVQFTPVIGTVHAQVTFNMSVVNHTGYADNGLPVLGSRSINTEFKVPRDGTELTLGGLVRKRRVDSTNKMPWLGDLPVLGYLFGGESRIDQESMVMISFSGRVVEFGTSTVTDADTAVEEIVNGTRTVETADNDPGFLEK